MVDTLDHSDKVLADDPRIRPSINTFLSHFMGKYAADFAFENHSVFGATNPPVKRKINFMNMPSDAIEAMTESELREGLAELGVDVTQYSDKEALVNKALML